MPYKDREKQREAHRRWLAKNPENREKQRAAISEWKRRNVDRLRETQRVRRANDYEKYKNTWRQQYAKNPEKARVRTRAWRAANPEKQRNSTNSWLARNPGITRVYVQSRRSRLLAASGTFTLEQMEARFAMWGGMCAYCTRRVGTAIDHVIPLSRGGSNWPANLRPACKPCNSSKHDRLLNEWINRPK